MSEALHKLTLQQAQPPRKQLPKILPRQFLMVLFPLLLCPARAVARVIVLL